MWQLTNARGETVDLDSEKLFANTPTGLGVQFSNTYSQYETYFKATKSTVTQGQFQINILFGDVESQAYRTFSDFAQFLAYQPLTLTYTTDSGTWYRDGRLNSLTKTEIGGSTVFSTDRINESFTLEFINNWYNNKTAEYKSYDPDPNLGTYGKIYGNQIADTSIQINSQGQQNKLVNTEFSPDFAGWYSGNNSSSGQFVLGNPLSSNLAYSMSSEKYSGSNVLLLTHGSATLYMHSDLIPVGAGVPISFGMQAYSSSTYNGTVSLIVTATYYDSSKNYISQSSTGNSGKITAWTRRTLSATTPTNTAYVSFAFGTNGSAGTTSYSQPMLVFDTTVGDYVKGLEYKHVATPAYTYAYAPYYVYQESNRPSNEKVMSLNNKSQYFGLQSGSPSIITVKGPCSVNPTWTVVQKGNVVATDGFVLTLTNNQKLVVSSYPEDQYARLYNPDGSYVDVSQLQDYTKTNFVQIPEGESTVLFYLDADSDVNITFKEERLLV